MILPQDNSPRQLSLFDAIEIPLTRGQVALVDPIDADLMRVKWFAHFRSSRTVYAVANSCGIVRLRKSLKLHRVIMERVLGRQLASCEQVDHVNGNGLDNRRSNLRLATPSQNQFNSRRRVSNTSGYKGVSWSERNRKWLAFITINYRRIQLGSFDTPAEAHAAYVAAAQKYAGEFARGE